MADDSFTLGELAEHRFGVGASPRKSLRQILGRPSGPVRIGARAGPISVLTQNMALLVAPAPYLGTDRGGAVAEICARIRALSPDIVGLCEVFKDSERDEIRTTVKDIYPYFREGPDQFGVNSDGGLLLLSRFPLLASNDFIFDACDGIDCWANKGVLHIRVRGTQWPTALDIFYSHTQNISTGAGQPTLHAQIADMREFIEAHADHELPAIVMGDLNIPAERTADYTRLLRTLDGFRDSWTLVGNPIASGPTFVTNNTFYEDEDDRPGTDQRLDYILLRPADRVYPITSEVEIMRFTHNGLHISDNFGLHAVFNPIAVIDP
ncbi:Metal-dependent hydrolase, endonuclease/exonuclease/phosphatase family [Nocardia amikacinitolerans]|uniref:endonuclease/exonuclease/phosphatase family protein n=1 Tax=Nocardia amikacinitolerans TaxID=756689 RepID=UPI0020A3FB5E|nr:endonuclease/exonuclease/phosphatase family protein [Nocardia amikacinitolerans]MCP2293914.1 Metal-dependent hydrolase, endonuclease/exonuclease/phosphatase family [Nocardia amikacinitolerans]